MNMTMGGMGVSPQGLGGMSPAGPQGGHGMGGGMHGNPAMAGMQSGMGNIAMNPMGGPHGMGGMQGMGMGGMGNPGQRTQMIVDQAHMSTNPSAGNMGMNPAGMMNPMGGMAGGGGGGGGQGGMGLSPSGQIPQMNQVQMNQAYQILSTPGNPVLQICLKSIPGFSEMPMPMQIQKIHALRVRLIHFLADLRVTFLYRFINI